MNCDPVPLPRSLAHRSPEEFARLYRPFLRFDGSADSFCYPDEVNKPKHELFPLNHLIQATNENNNECKPFNSSAPIY